MMEQPEFTKKFKSTALYAAVIASFLSLPVLGQDEQKSTVRALEEIVVVARRTEENLQTVPISVTAITAEAIQANTIQSGLDLQKMVPTLSVVMGTQASAATYSLRGIRSGVLTYFDETPTSATAVNYQLFDLASVQAISGPQGTLFGRNSTGGAILFVPNKPTEEFEASIDAGLGDYNRREITGMVNVPAHEKLQIRLNAKTVRRDGVVENLAGRDLQSIGRDSFRASVMFKPLDWLTNYTMIDAGETDETQFGHIMSGYPGGACNFATFQPLFACFYGADLPLQLQNQQLQIGNRKVATPFRELMEAKDRGFQNTLTANLGDYTLKYIAAYRSAEHFQLHNQISIAIPAIVGQGFNESDQESHELQLSGSAFNDRLSWVSGLFYLETDSDTLNGFLILAPLNSPEFSLEASQNSPTHFESTSKAAYAQASYALTDRLDITLGLRYTEDDQSAEFSAFAPGFTCILDPTVSGVDLVNCIQPQGDVFDATTYNLSLGYQLNPATFVYAATRKGYNAGGFNQGLDPDAAAYDPEILTDYEVGIKSDWYIGAVPVRTNLSTYYGKYEDIQRSASKLIDTPTGPRAFAGVFNAAEATIYGAQFEFMVRPFESLTLTGSYGYLHSEYDKFDANQLQGSATGNSFAQAPEHTANISATYSYPLAIGELVVNAGYAYLSEVTFTDTNVGRDVSFQDGYGLVDARIELQNIANLPLDIGIWGKNLTDKEYKVNISDQVAFGFTSNVFADPRTFGLNMKYRLGAK